MLHLGIFLLLFCLLSQLFWFLGFIPCVTPNVSPFWTRKFNWNLSSFPFSVPPLFLYQWFHKCLWWMTLGITGLVPRDSGSGLGSELRTELPNPGDRQCKLTKRLPPPLIWPPPHVGVVDPPRGHIPPPPSVAPKCRPKTGQKGR